MGNEDTVVQTVILNHVTVRSFYFSSMIFGDVRPPLYISISRCSIYLQLRADMGGRLHSSGAAIPRDDVSTLLFTCMTWRTLMHETQDIDSRGLVFS